MYPSHMNLVGGWEDGETSWKYLQTHSGHGFIIIGRERKYQNAQAVMKYSQSAVFIADTQN